jgi:Protein of unknown function (DUF4230)
MYAFSDKICCHQPKARLVASKFSTIVLGGTAALHAYRAWGAVLFADEVSAFFVLVLLILLVLVLLLEYRLERNENYQTLNVQRSMSKSAISGRMSWPVAFTLVALIIAAVVLVIVVRLETWPARTAHQSTAELERIGKNLRAAFIDIAHLQPRITINNRVYMEQTRPMSELVVLSRQIEVEHELLHTWVGSSKRVKLHGTFNVKAGFDLRQNLSIDIQPNEIIVQLPHAEILGIEEGQLDVLAFENGLWNRISGADVQNELSILPQLAREKATESGLPAQAEHALQQQIEQRIHTQQPLRLIFTNGQKRE